MITKYGIYKYSYNIASRSFEILPELVNKLFTGVSITHIKSIAQYLDVYKISTESEYDIDVLFRKFNIYPLSIDEVLGFVKKDWVTDETNPITPEQFVGESGTLPDLYQQIYARVAWERFHMDSTSKFIVGDSFSELLKSVIIMGSVITGTTLTEEQTTKVQTCINRLIDIYGDVDYCIDKLEAYTQEVSNMMANYKTIKATVSQATTSEDVWK